MPSRSQTIVLSCGSVQSYSSKTVQFSLALTTQYLKRLKHIGRGEGTGIREHLEDKSKIYKKQNIRKQH